jgi:predicted amidohydrolase YtcJ
MKILSTLCLAVCLAACSSEQAPRTQTAELVIRGARIWTGDAEQPWAQALAISKERLLAVGSDTRISQLIGPDTELIDSPPGLVVPGFIDSHVHMMESGFELSSVQLRDAQTPAEFSRLIGDFADFMTAGEWMLGGTWDHQNWGGELPHRNWIDAVTPRTPVMVARLDGHMVLANSLALELAGVDENTPDVEGGEIVRDADGVPTGVLKDNAMTLVSRVIPTPTLAQQDQALQQAMDYLAEHGVTTVHDMGYSWDSLATYRRAHISNTLRTRIYASVPIADWQRLADEVAERGRGDNWLRIGGLKGFMDGSLGSHTAAFFEPFTDTPDDRGFFLTSMADMREWIIGADKAGLQLLIHAIGDRANASLLEMYNVAIIENGARDRRFRIEHAQHLRQEDIDRIASMGVIPSMQPYHAIDDGRWAEAVIGEQRARTTYAFWSLMTAGATVSFGSDWSVAPASPLLGIYAASTRQTLDGAHPEGWVPEQKISVEQALVAYTRNGAYASFEEASKGSLTEGKLADVVILDRDITVIPTQEIRQARVDRTIVGGRTVYQRNKTQGSH